MGRMVLRERVPAASRSGASLAPGATDAPRRSGPSILPVVAIALVVVVLAVRLLVPEESPLSGRAADFFTLTFSVLIESLPFVVLGILLSTLVQVWLPSGAIERILPRNPFTRRACVSLIGMLLPVCECGNVPLARGLLLRGFSVPESMTFLLAAPILNPVVIVSTHQAFGWDGGILVWRLVGGFLLANLVGWIFSRHPRPDELLTPRFSAMCEADEHGEGGRMSRSIAQFRTETAAVMPSLVIGCVIAGLVQILVPRDVLVRLGSDPLLSVGAMMLLAVVVSICSNVDAFFVLSFGSTFLPGAITAFLVLGPVIDVKMLALMRTTYRTRTLVQLCLVALLFVAALGLGVNVLG